MTIIENEKELDILQNKLTRNESFFLFVPENPFDNSPFNKTSALFVYLCQNEETYCLIGTHSDFDNHINIESFITNIETNKFIYVYNKRLLLSEISCKLNNLKSNFIDVNFASYVTENRKLVLNDEMYLTNTYRKFLSEFGQKMNNEIIPINSHYEYYKLVLESFIFIYDTHKYVLMKNKKLLIHLDEYYTNNYYEFEQHGISVDSKLLKRLNKTVFIKKGKIYSNYKFFTKTGRPTNTFCKLNLLALDKSSNIRKSFVSRFNDDGLLYQFDYNSFHLKLISVLLNINIDEKNLHVYLGKKMFPDDPTIEYNEIKIKIFKQLYGGISHEYMNIDFFKKLNDFINQLWETLNGSGVVFTKLFKRPMYKNKLSNDINKITFFNYYIQSFESEFCSNIIYDINQYIKQHNLKSTLILYTYDSFLFDMHKDEYEYLLQLKKIIEFNNFFDTTMKFGSNYNELNLVKL